jgi:hypothetical protein
MVLPHTHVGSLLGWNCSPGEASNTGWVNSQGGGGWESLCPEGALKVPGSAPLLWEGSKPGASEGLTATC